MRGIRSGVLRFSPAEGAAPPLTPPPTKRNNRLPYCFKMISGLPSLN